MKVRDGYLCALLTLRLVVPSDSPSWRRGSISSPPPRAVTTTHAYAPVADSAAASAPRRALLRRVSTGALGGAVRSSIRIRRHASDVTTASVAVGSTNDTTTTLPDEAVSPFVRMADGHQRLRSAAAPAAAAMTAAPSSTSGSARRRSMSRAQLDTPPSWWSRLCCCLGGGTGSNDRGSYGGGTGSGGAGAGGFRASLGSNRANEQIPAENPELKKKVARYSTMRVHMKRVQLCLEQEKRNKFYKELVIYLCFLVVVMISLMSLPIHFPYEQNTALRDLFFDEEFPDIAIRKTFSDAMVEDELWQWVEGPFLDGFYNLPIRNMRRIGSVMVRSGRVKGDLCRYTNGRTDFVLFADEFCYPEFTPHSEERDPFGDASPSGAFPNAPYNWTSGLVELLRSQTFTPSLFNHEMSYGRGGYAVYLPRDNATAAGEIVTQLKEDFLTDSTRYFVVSFAFYNARSDIFTHIQGLFELSDTDYMETTSRVKSFRILPSVTSSSFFWDNLYVFTLGFAMLWLLVRELSDLREFGWRKYVHSLWNLLDLLQLVLLVMFLESWISYLVLCEDIRDQLYKVARMDCASSPIEQDSARDCYVELEPLAWRFLSVTNYAAGLALVSVAIVFKYLRLNTRLNLLWRTLRFAAKDLLAFVVIFFVIFFAFAVMGFLTFGSSVRRYHSLSVSLTSGFQMLLGAFDYNEIYEANPAMAGIFFFSFMISVYLICINMFIAIMSEYYSLAQTEKRTHEENQRMLATTDQSAKNSGSGDGDEFSDSLQFTDVEYDLAKQVESYVLGLRVRVRLPPKKEATTIYQTEQLVVSGGQRILLVDYDYLQAERHRLKLKLRGYVHTVAATAFMMRSVRGADFRMQIEHRYVVDLRPRPQSIDSLSSLSSLGDVADFPIVYIPVSSTQARPGELLRSLKPGMFVEMDDGSFTKDQITLEVLGDQSAYVPPHYVRYADGASDDEAAASLPPDFRLQMSRAGSTNEDEDGVEDQDDNDGQALRHQESRATTKSMPAKQDRQSYQSQSQSQYGGKQLPFGLRHTHSELELSGRHIRCCRVLYNGDAVLDGREACLFPRRVWASYFVRHVVWGSIKRFFRFRFRRGHASAANTRRLITDMEVDRLITEHFLAPGRGISCRFDELVRNFRMLIAKKMHKKNWRVVDMEDRIFTEVISFLERFPSALSPLDKRELEGYKYTPQPVDTKSVRLPNSILLLAELLAQNAHEVWAIGRVAQGWRWGPARDNDKLLHPDLVPYEDLREQDKQYDRDTSMEALKVIRALGYILEPPATHEDFDIVFGTANVTLDEPPRMIVAPPSSTPSSASPSSAPTSEPTSPPAAVVMSTTYQPRPIPTEKVKVPSHLKMLIELLAENTHEVWAKMRLEQGWKFGPRRDDDKKEHNGLVPYIYLTQQEKEMDRNTALQTVKVILRCGFAFVHKDKMSSSHRSSRKKASASSNSMRAFGRNENAEAHHVSDAVSLARGTARAKHAFLRRDRNGRRTISAGLTRSGGVSGGGGSGSGRSLGSFRTLTNRTLSAESDPPTPSPTPTTTSTTTTTAGRNGALPLHPFRLQHQRHGISMTAAASLSPSVSVSNPSRATGFSERSESLPAMTNDDSTTPTSAASTAVSRSPSPRPNEEEEEQVTPPRSAEV